MTEAVRSPETLNRWDAPSADRRKLLRYVAAALCTVVGVLYLILLFLVRDAEVGLTEDTYGAYLFLAVPYLVGAVLLVALDRRFLWAVGALVQVFVITLFAMFGAGLFGPGQGVFDYAALSGLHMELWAATITGAELILLGLLSYMAFTTTPHQNEPDLPATLGADTPLP